MIQANKSASFEALFSTYNRLLLRRSFSEVSVRLHPEVHTELPTLYVANHSSWWDGLIAFQANRCLIHQDAYVMMSEQGLRQFRFFRKLGAFSIDRSSASGVRTSLAYCEELLRRPKAALWLFPQGDIRHQDVRPLGFLPGVGFLLDRLPAVQLVPITISYDFLLDQRPHVFVEFGAPLKLDALPLTRNERTAAIEAAVTCQLDQLKRSIIDGQLTGFTRLAGGASSISEQFTRIFNRSRSQ
ncbi:lysophospholipid acyltransferase family protein [Paenibacillus sp. YYML68]|uniref:lysophospholipid acyltransferase family protein n=1 Tax=Paenibacillus sp. YYML68 TaxID=2909250 RepID=UPI0024912471|nr:lysophospholipid acyltransferase family protein [Paenibacillus sp. YYML68]